MVMIDTDMIASPNYVRFVYDGDGDELGPAGPAGSGTVERIFKRYFSQRGMATLPQAFDGRSDYVGFINRGIPAEASSRAPSSRRQRRKSHFSVASRASSTTRATTRRATTSTRSRVSRPRRR